MAKPIEKRHARDPTTDSPRPTPPPAKTPRDADEHLYGGGGMDKKPLYRDSDPAERDQPSRRDRDDLDDS